MIWIGYVNMLFEYVCLYMVEVTATNCFVWIYDTKQWMNMYLNGIVNGFVNMFIELIFDRTLKKIDWNFMMVMDIVAICALYYCMYLSRHAKSEKVYICMVLLGLISELIWLRVFEIMRYLIYIVPHSRTIGAVSSFCKYVISSWK